MSGESPVEELTGLAQRCSRPGGRDPWHPRRDAGLRACARPMLAELRVSRHLNSPDGESLSVSERWASVASVDECVEQHRHRRPVDGARRRRPPQRRGGRSIRAAIDGVLAAVRAGGFTLAERKKLASFAFATPPMPTWPLRVGWGGSTRIHRKSRFTMGRPRHGSVRGAAFTGRTRISRRLSTASNDSAWPGSGAGRAAARKRDVPATTSPMPTPPGGPPSNRTSRPA